MVKAEQIDLNVMFSSATGTKLIIKNMIETHLQYFYQ